MFLLYQEERELERSLEWGPAEARGAFFLQACFLPEWEVGLKVSRVPCTDPLPDLSDPRITDGPRCS